MAFNLAVRFTGICAFVPDKPFNRSPKKVCVVLPDAYFDNMATPRDAPDNTKLRRHRPMVFFSLRDVAGTPATAPDAIAIWYLDKQRLTFETTGVGPTLKVGDLSKMIDVSAVAPGYDTVDPKLLGWGEKATQVMFDRGYLEAPIDDPRPWVFPNTLSQGQVVEMKGGIASVVTLTLEGLTSLKIWARPLAGGDPLCLELKPPGRHRLVTVDIAHLCDDNPLRWARKKAERVQDEDFKWYFKLLDPNATAKLQKALKGLPLPYHYPVGRLNGQGANCPPAGMRPASFTMD